MKMQIMDKRHRIQSAAIQLFQEQGVETTTVNEIVQRANVAKGTFYVYYKDKKELISQILTKQHGCLLNNIINQSYAHSGGDVKMWKITFVNNLIAYYLEHPKLLKSIQKNISSIFVTEEHRNEVFQRVEKLELFLETLARAQESKKQTMNRFMLMMEIIGIVCYNAIFFQHPDGIENILPELKLTMMKMIESEE